MKFLFVAFIGFFGSGNFQSGCHGDRKCGENRSFLVSNEIQFRRNLNPLFTNRGQLINYFIYYEMAQ